MPAEGSSFLSCELIREVNLYSVVCGPFELYGVRKASLGHGLLVGIVLGNLYTQSMGYVLRMYSVHAHWQYQ